MQKITRVGHGPNGHVFVKIKFNDGKLSITGVEGPKRNGDCQGSCGQIDLHDGEFDAYGPGFSAETVERLRFLWRRWHLNDMQAGSPAQTAHLRALPSEPQTYEKARDQLREHGLNPDPNYIHNGKPYSYGSAWLHEEVPEDVIEWLFALPDTDITPEWV